MDVNIRRLIFRQKLHFPNQNVQQIDIFMITTHINIQFCRFAKEFQFSQLFL